MPEVPDDDTQVGRDASLPVEYDASMGGTSSMEAGTGVTPDASMSTGPIDAGCADSDVDSDQDGVPDCADACPADANKIWPALCGCGEAESDSDADGTPDCVDQCPNDEDKTEPGGCGCGVPDVDADNTGVLDCNECRGDPNIVPGVCGCGIPEIARVW
jgi:hypothetical protein